MFEGKEPPFAAEARFSTSVGRGAFPTKECSLTTATGVYDGNMYVVGWVEGQRVLRRYRLLLIQNDASVLLFHRW